MFRRSGGRQNNPPNDTEAKPVTVNTRRCSSPPTHDAAEPENRGRRQHHAGRATHPVTIHDLTHRPGGLWEVEADVGAARGRFLFHAEYRTEEFREPNGRFRRMPPRVEHVDPELLECTEVDEDGEPVGCLVLTFGQTQRLVDAVEARLFEAIGREVTARWTIAVEDEAEAYA